MCLWNHVWHGTYLGLKNVTLLKDLLDNFLLLVGAELAVELAVRSAIEDTGGSLPVDVLVSAGYGGVIRMFVRTCG